MVTAAYNARNLCRCNTYIELSQKLICSLFSGAGLAMPSTPGLMLTGNRRKRYALVNQLNTLTILSTGTVVEWSNSQHLNTSEHTFQLLDLIVYLGLSAFILPLSIHPLVHIWYTLVALLMPLTRHCDICTWLTCRQADTIALYTWFLTLLQETRQYFLKLCGSKAEEALALASQGPFIKQEPASLPIPETAAASGLQAASPHSDSKQPIDQAHAATAHPQPGTAFPPDQTRALVAEAVQADAASPPDQTKAHAAEAVQADAALPIEEQGLDEVRSRLNSLLQELPFQEAVDAVSAQMPKSPVSHSSAPSPQGTATATAAASAAAAVGKQPASAQKSSRVDATPTKPHAELATATAAATPLKEQASAPPPAGPRPGEVAVAVPVALTAVAGSSKKRKRPAAMDSKADAIAAEAAATAAEDDAAGRSPPFTVPVVCNGLCGVFDGTCTMVLPLNGKRCRPSVFEASAGKGAAKKWRESIRVDEGDGTPGIAIGVWLKQAKLNGLKPRGGHPRIGKASPSDVAAPDLAGNQATPEASAHDEEEPAGAVATVDPGNTRHTEQGNGGKGNLKGKQPLKHVSSNPNLECLVTAPCVGNPACHVSYSAFCTCMLHKPFPHTMCLAMLLKPILP